MNASAQPKLTGSPSPLTCVPLTSAPVNVLFTQSERAELGEAVPGFVVPSPFSQFCTKTWLPPAL